MSERVFVVYDCEDCGIRFAVEDSEEWSETTCPVCGSPGTEYVDHARVAPVEWRMPRREAAAGE